MARRRIGADTLSEQTMAYLIDEYLQHSDFMG